MQTCPVGARRECAGYLASATDLLSFLFVIRHFVIYELGIIITKHDCWHGSWTFLPLPCQDAYISEAADTGVFSMPLTSQAGCMPAGAQSYGSGARQGCEGIGQQPGFLFKAK